MEFDALVEFGLVLDAVGTVFDGVGGLVDTQNFTGLLIPDEYLVVGDEVPVVVRISRHHVRFVGSVLDFLYVHPFPGLR